MKSNCCNASISTIFGGEGTNFYECDNCGHPCDQKIEYSLGSKIDPIAQIFMDFYADLMEPNDDGETINIRYDEWAKKVRMMLFFDCACREPLRKNISHGKYQCMNHETGKGTLRADFHKDDDFFKFEEESKEDIDKEIDEIIGNIQGD